MPTPIATNRFARRAVGLFAAAALVAVSLTAPVTAEIPAFDRVRVLPQPRPIADAVLTDQNGLEFRLGDLHGRVAFVLFGFTNCPDVCPLAMERMRQLHDSELLDPASVAYVMVSVDGERDTPAAMKAFVAEYSDGFVGLTAAPSDVKPIAAQFSAAFFKDGHAGHDGGYDVSHSPQVFVLDPSGELRAELYSASIEAMAGVADALLTEAQ
jgi:protein SCO1/2